MTVGKGTAKPDQTLDGRFLIRVGSTNRQATKEALSRLFQAAGLVHFAISPVAETGLADLDEAKLQTYWDTAYQPDSYRLTGDQRINLLLNADLLSLHEGAPVCTIGGLLTVAGDAAGPLYAGTYDGGLWRWSAAGSQWEALASLPARVVPVVAATGSRVLAADH